MKKLANRTKVLDAINLHCDADARSIIENELETSLSGTGPTIEDTLAFTRYL